MTTAVLQFSGTQPLRGESLTISVMEGANTSRQDFTSHVGTGSNRRGALEDSRTILHTSSMDSEEKFSRFSFGVTGASRGSSKLKTLNFYFFFPSPRSVTNTGCKKYLTLKPYVLRKKLKSKTKKKLQYQKIKVSSKKKTPGTDSWPPLQCRRQIQHSWHHMEGTLPVVLEPLKQVRADLMSVKDVFALKTPLITALGAYNSRPARWIFFSIIKF